MKLKKEITRKVGEMAKKVAAETVGRSHPFGIYEVKVPEHLKNK